MRKLIIIFVMLLMCPPALADPSLGSPPDNVRSLPLVGPAVPIGSLDFPISDFTISDANYVGLPAAAVSVDWVDIGDTASDEAAGRNLSGWSDAIKPSGGYGGATDSVRMVWEGTGPGDDPNYDLRTASIDMYFGDKAGDKYIAFRWLDGQSADGEGDGDSFKFSISDTEYGSVQNGVDTDEAWYDLVAWNVGDLTGWHTVTLEATDDPWPLQGTYGQVAISEIATYQIPAPGAALLCILGLGMVRSLRRWLT